MLSSKKIAHLAKRCQRMMAASGQQTSGINECCSTTSVAEKGHCVMYSADGTQFKVPLVYLGKRVLAELLRISQEEFGFTSHGKITLPCDASVMEYLICLLRREASEEVERAFLSSIVSPCHKACSVAPSMGLNQQFVVCRYRCMFWSSWMYIIKIIGIETSMPVLWYYLT